MVCTQNVNWTLSLLSFYRPPCRGITSCHPANIYHMKLNSRRFLVHEEFLNYLFEKKKYLSLCQKVCTKSFINVARGFEAVDF